MAVKPAEGVKMIIWFLNVISPYLLIFYATKTASVSAGAKTRRVFAPPYELKHPAKRLIVK